MCLRLCNIIKWVLEVLILNVEWIALYGLRLMKNWISRKLDWI